MIVSEHNTAYHKYQRNMCSQTNITFKSIVLSCGRLLILVRNFINAYLGHPFVYHIGYTVINAHGGL